MHLPPVPRFFVRWIIRLSILLIFVGMPAGLFYLREFGVGFGLKERIAEALSGTAFHTTIGKLSFDPFKGLVAERVEVRQIDGEVKTPATIQRLIVSLNLGKLLERQIFIDLLEFDDTDVDVPIGDKSQRAILSLRDVSGQLLFQPGQVRLSFFQGDVQGIRILVSGLLLNPEALRTAHKLGKSAPTKRQDFLGDIVSRFSDLKFPRGAPEIRAQVSGDLSDLSTLHVSPITLKGGPIVAPQWRVEGIEADAEYVGGNFNLKRLVLRDREGALTASAQWGAGALTFEASSSLLMGPFLQFLPPKSPVRDVHFIESPQFQVRGQMAFSSTTHYDLTGAVRTGKLAYRGVNIDAISATFAMRDGAVFVRDARLLANDREASGDVMFAPGDFRLRLSNTIPPTYFASMLGEKEREFLGMMKFKDSPYVQAEVRGSKPDFAAITGEGFIRLGRTAMRDSWIDGAESRIEIADRAVTYRDISLWKGKGLGTGTFVYDFGRHEVRLNNINSTLSPVDVLMWADPKIAEVVKAYRFHAPPKVQANGLIHMRDLQKNNLALKVESAEGLDYDLLNKTLKFGRTSADVNIISTKVNANVKRAKLMGGEVALKALVSITPADPTYGAVVDVKRVNFTDLTKLYFDYDDSKGVLSGTFQFNTRMGDETKMRGTGSIRVEDGNVFAIPILGPLSEIINKIIPGAGFQTARMATSDFTMGDEKITAKEINIDGAGFSMIGHGDIFFMTDKMDMSVRINARGVPGLVLFPVSKLFEYVSTGTVSNPEWRPKIIPRF